MEIVDQLLCHTKKDDEYRTKLCEILDELERKLVLLRDLINTEGDK